MAWHNSWQPDASRPVTRHLLCGLCALWLAGVIAEVGRDGIVSAAAAGGRIFGAPGTSGRALLFEDQCHVCHAIPAGGGSLIDCVSPESQAQSWAPFFACPPCDAWIGSLADDGRSIRMATDREIDGPYGEWPHPNLRDLTVQVEVADRAASAVVLESCAAMGVAAGMRSTPGRDSVLILEATNGSGARVARERPKRGAVIMVAAPHAIQPLREALAAGADQWLTNPLTPQQVTAVLSATLRRQLRLNWDVETALPVAAGLDPSRAALSFEPFPGTERFAIAWMIRRFSRGYDDAAVVAGEILLFPRAPQAQIGRIRARLARVLEGRCHVNVRSGDELRPRFEATG